MNEALTKQATWLGCLQEQQDLSCGELASRDTNEEVSQEI